MLNLGTSWQMSCVTARGRREALAAGGCQTTLEAQRGLCELRHHETGNLR